MIHDKILHNILFWLWAYTTESVVVVGLHWSVLYSPSIVWLCHFGIGPLRKSNPPTRQALHDMLAQLIQHMKRSKVHLLWACQILQFEPGRPTKDEWRPGGKKTPSSSLRQASVIQSSNLWTKFHCIWKAATHDETSAQKPYFLLWNDSWSYL